MLKVITVAWLLLFLGDFLSTFCYHIPQHVFGKLHLQVHHSPRQHYWHYAVISTDPNVLLDGILGALPYLFLALPLGFLSLGGVVLGLALGQFHVWWRHTTALQWQTPQLIGVLCRFLSITTPELHWEHHRNTTRGYGDIFTIFDKPGRVWLRQLRRWRYRLKASLALVTRI
ncbi:MAG: sterol desaturase family protein [Cyanobacteriota bacterium]|nr:sterol desaturase family protein [Cyanobacteriota bacterium]